MRFAFVKTVVITSLAWFVANMDGAVASVLSEWNV